MANSQKTYYELIDNFVKNITTMRTLLLICALFISTQLFAQSNVIFIDFNKLPTTAIENSFNNDKAVVETAIANKMKSYKGKQSKKSGFTIYQGLNIPEISNSPVDLYFKTASSKKNTTTIHVLVSSGNEQFFTNENDADVIRQAQVFVESIQTNVEQAQLESDIAAQAKLVKSADKDLSKKKSELQKLEKQKKDIENKIAKTQKEIDQAEANLNKMKSEQKSLQSQD